MTIARLAIESLLEELNLTPKPGLVDLLNSGCHQDLDWQLMVTSALSLYQAFYDIATAAAGQEPSQRLREQLAAIGRYGEQKMFSATGGINTHKGAIWCLGLLSAATAIVMSNESSPRLTSELFTIAGAIAQFKDRYWPVQTTHGRAVLEKYQVAGAGKEAMHGFPSIREAALATAKRFDQDPESIQRLNMLVALMAVVDDTCIIHRTDMTILRTIQKEAAAIIENGGLGWQNNWDRYLALEQYMTTHWVSPGGSADLLAGAIFIQKVSNHFKLE